MTNSYAVMSAIIDTKPQVGDWLYYGIGKTADFPRQSYSWVIKRLRRFNLIVPSKPGAKRSAHYKIVSPITRKLLKSFLKDKNPRRTTQSITSSSVIPTTQELFSIKDESTQTTNIDIPVTQGLDSELEMLADLIAKKFMARLKEALK